MRKNSKTAKEKILRRLKTRKNKTKIKNITIPSKVKYVGEGAFEDCTSIKSVIVEKELFDYDRIDSWHPNWNTGIENVYKYNTL